MNNSDYLVKSKIIVRQSIYQLLLGIIGSLFWIGSIVHMTLFPNDTAVLGVHLFFVFMSLISLWFIWLFIIWKVVLEDGIIQFTNCLNKTTTIRIEEIEKVKFKIPRNPKHESEAILITKSGKEFLTTPGSARGAGEFIKHLRRANIKFE